ncbi:hypothetical protein C2E23DRAFT_881373 [Lenzites betulinus]|nr:hypothetical protein C2E23DRAFT_881373 [Lenzites betulinus]
MPRRSPPTPLRLHAGPLPARGHPKHTLPSLPRPAFHGPALSYNTSPTAGPVPRARMAHTALPPLVIPDFGLPGALAGLFTAQESAPSSPTSAGSSASVGSTGSMGSVERKRSREFVRGPWDHSGAIRVPFDVGAVLPPPRPVAINVR